MAFEKGSRFVYFYSINDLGIDKKDIPEKYLNFLLPGFVNSLYFESEIYTEYELLELMDLKND